MSLSVPAGLSLTATAATAGGRGPQCILPTPPSSPDSSTRPFLAPGLGQTPLLGLLHVPYVTTACLSPPPRLGRKLLLRHKRDEVTGLEIRLWKRNWSRGQGTVEELYIHREL